MWADQRHRWSYICHIHLRWGKYIYTYLWSKLTFRVAIMWCKGDHANKVTGMIDSVFERHDQKNNVQRMPYMTQSRCTTICLLIRKIVAWPLPSRSVTCTDFFTKTYLDDTAASGQPSLHLKQNKRDKAKLQHEQQAAVTFSYNHNIYYMNHVYMVYNENIWPSASVIGSLWLINPSATLQDLLTIRSYISVIHHVIVVYRRRWEYKYSGSDEFLWCCILHGCNLSV